MSRFEIRFRGASIGPASSPIFRDFEWTVEPFQVWVITGPNGGGKSSLAQALAGGLQVSGGGASPNVLPLPDSVALISFERQRDLFFDERYHDDSDFVEGGVDPGTSARDFILGPARARSAAAGEFEVRVRRLGIETLLDRGLKYLSTGEIRKVLLCRELLRKPALLIFDEPYEGLDAGTRAVLSEEIDRLIGAALTSAARAATPDEPVPSRVLIITDRYEHVPQLATHVLYLDRRQALFAGPRAEFEASDLRARLGKPDETASLALTQALSETLIAGSDAAGQPPGSPPEALVQLCNVRVTYSERNVLDGLNLKIGRGDHTLVRGPNGCGKTTLLNLINGDNPQVYANDVTVCGMKRGSGESVWDVKAKLGQVSYALHVEYAYRCTANVIEAVLSGFYDSIGLYREPSFVEIRAAERWLKLVGLLDKRAEPFVQLSYGEQRVALIARAVIKQPPLLILDEPCHGLDVRHREQVLTIANYIGEHESSTILYVTHDPAERLACTRQLFEFDGERGWTLTEARPARPHAGIAHAR